MNIAKKKRENPKLNKYEQDLENNLHKSKPLPATEKMLELTKLKSAAKEHLHKKRKEKRISIRVFAKDLDRLKEIAEEEGLPYQTLVTSVLHKFSTGRLIAREQNKH